MAEEHVLFYLIQFTDGDFLEGQVLHVGSKESCQELQRLMPAVSYSGEREVVGAAMFIEPNTQELSPGELVRVDMLEAANA